VRFDEAFFARRGGDFFGMGQRPRLKKTACYTVYCIGTAATFFKRTVGLSMQPSGRNVP
jgi:hypothetical protein